MLGWRRMPAEPHPYPRIPHLPPGTGASRDDRVLSSRDARPFFVEEIALEEKLDGASVVLWLDDHGGVAAATRGGGDAIDRAGQRGPLRAWAAGRTDQLRGLLAGGWALYGEWLWFTHAVRYDQLPDWLIALDLWHPLDGFAAHEARAQRVRTAGLSLPPELYRGIVGDADALASLVSRSGFTDGPPEGVVVRRLTATPGALRVAKALAPGYAAADDARWRSPARNALAAGPTAIA